jgi:hypothetical protein
MTTWTTEKCVCECWVVKNLAVARFIKMGLTVVDLTKTQLQGEPFLQCFVAGDETG